MAVLRTLVLSVLLWLCLSVSGFAAIRNVQDPALKNLLGCQPIGADYWAKRMDQSDPGLAAVYRLAWIQRLASRQNTAMTEVSPEQVAWKVESELWDDERDGLESLGGCASETPAISFAAIPEEVLDETMKPLLSRATSLSTAGQRLLKDWLFFRWQSGHSEKWELDSTTTDPEWMALASLHQGANRSVPRKLPDSPSVILSAWLLQQGDLAFGSGAFAKAVSLYESGFKLSPTAPTFPQWYRMASARLATADSNLATLRAALFAMEGADEENNGESFRPALANQVCTWLGQFGASETERAFVKVVGAKTWKPHAQRLLRNCSTSGSASLAQALLKKATTPRERSELTAKLMGLAERDGRVSRARSLAEQLAKLSRVENSSAGFYFWKEVTSPKSALVSAYKKKAAWTAGDQARLKSVASSSIPLEESLRAKKVLLLPNLRNLPELSKGEPVVVDFVARFSQATSRTN